MASSKDPYSILNKDPERGVLKPKFDPSVKVERYRPGTLPKWAQEEAGEPQEDVSAAVRSSSISIDSCNFQVTDLCSMPATDCVSVPPRPSSPVHSDSDLYESDDYAYEPPKPLFKPVFVPKQQRVTETETVVREAEEEALQAELHRQAERRKEETQRLIAEAMTQEAQDVQSDSEVVSDSDDPGDPAEYKQWKLREVKRVIRETSERSARAKELAEVERRRNLTDWERSEENKRLGTDETVKPERMPMRYMQKWAHAGAFFQDRDDEGKLEPIFMRDVNAPVEGDFDKSVLPEALQKRRGNFGVKGQSKWTHLTAEDTTDFNPAFKPDEKLVLKQQLKQGGYKAMNRFH